jgi:hypothetical protein
MADKYVVFMEENTKDIDTVCEIGAGIFKNFHHYGCSKKIGIELIESYVENREYREDDCEALVGDANDFEAILGDRQVDAIGCIDFIEHLEKDVAIKLIERMKNVCGRIFIYTPHGTCNMDGVNGSTWGNERQWGGLLKGEDRAKASESQRHKSTWFEKDLLDLGFAVDRDSDRLSNDVKHEAVYGDDGGDVMWAIWNKDASTPLPEGRDKESKFTWK